MLSTAVVCFLKADENIILALQDSGFRQLPKRTPASSETGQIVSHYTVISIDDMMKMICMPCFQSQFPRNHALNLFVKFAFRIITVEEVLNTSKSHHNR